MRFGFETHAATFAGRPNRFVVVAKLLETGETVRAHCADPGRMKELLLPGTKLYLGRASHSHRKTAFDLHLVEHPHSGKLVSVNSQLPNRLFAEAMAGEALDELRDFHVVQHEVVIPVEDSVDHGSRKETRSRIDFLLEGEGGERMWVEVKSATLVQDHVAYFPDARTERGRRHVLELARLRQKGGARTAIVFIVQRADADSVRPQRDVDPQFADALYHAREQGVELLAYTCRVSLEEICIDRSIPVVVSPHD